MAKVHDWRKSDYQPDPKYTRWVVDVHLREIRTTKDVYWSVNTNSYVLVDATSPWASRNQSEDWHERYHFKVDGKWAMLVSINGAGELRWDVLKDTLESHLKHEKEPWWRETYEGAEALAAARHFGLIPKKEAM